MTAVTAELVDHLKGCIGDADEPVTITVDSLMSQRYARAIGETNPVYFDEAYARSLGYEGLLVPENFLPSLLDWSDGGPEESLRPDGTPTHELAWIPLEGLRLMGGGEEMIFHQPVTAGTTVVLESSLEDVADRETKSGPMAILRIRNTYRSDSGQLLMESVRTVLCR